MQQDEIAWREMAESIHHFANGEPSIVICPNSVEVAKTVSYHLCGAGDQRDDGRAYAIYGAQGLDADDLIEGFKRGDFPYAVSVNKLYKGFDACNVRNVFMLRKTRSRRLYEQAMGRAVRPLSQIRDELNSAEDAATRRSIIAGSSKPHCTMVDLVGVHPEAKDIGVIDILGEHLSTELRERTKRNANERFSDGDDSVDVGEVAREARDELKAEREAEAEAEAKRRRSLVQIKGDYTVEVSDNMSQTVVRSMPNTKKRGEASAKQVKLLIAFGVDPSTAASYGKRQAGSVITSYKNRGIEPTREGWIRANRWGKSNT